ncbi:DUF262 domain-containing protein [Sandaracinus amylolyticus]|uniref:DUF262 domain-containing protein n=1 Tax=Sandaracinus amylolyticus TaxID=927083 RepID=UPI0014701A01|nr:DUF262 domain-containing protein [Sandaracinus amylolyticus]
MRYELKTNATNRRIRELITAINQRALVSRPDFQRRLVWTNRDKVEFVDTILRALPFPEIYVCAGEVDPETAQGTEWLVDGQQRVSTIYEYFSGAQSLRLPPRIPAYAALTEAQKRSFLEYTVVVRDLGSVPLDYVKDVFSRINSTKYGLNAMELANARYDGAIKRSAASLAEHDFYSRRSVFKASDVRRMGDVSFQLSLLITMEAGYFDDTDEHERYLERYNDEYPRAPEMEARLNSVFAALDSADIAGASRWWKKADLFSLIVELDRAVSVDSRAVDPAALRTALTGFEQLLERYQGHDGEMSSAERERASRYSLAAAQGSNHRKSRITRGEILAEVIRSAST